MILIKNEAPVDPKNPLANVNKQPWKITVEKMGQLTEFSWQFSFWLF